MAKPSNDGVAKLKGLYRLDGSQLWNGKVLHMGIGATATTTLIRVNAALLFASRYLAALGYEDKIIDNFWTITGYFNSLRELGGASTQILDDVQSRFSYLAKTKFAALTPKVDLSVSYDNLVELTSRMEVSMKESIYKSYDELPLFLNAETVAKVLGVSPSSGYELMHEKDFPALKIGSRIVVPKEKFIAWVEQNTGGAI